jgi:hypothetical protein
MKARSTASQRSARTMAECVRGLRARGYTHTVGLDRDGNECPGTKPLSAWLSVRESHPRTYRLDGADLLRLSEGKPTRMARAISLPTSWHLLRHPWSEPASLAQVLVEDGFVLRDFCALCGAPLAGTIDENDEIGSMVFDQTTKVVHMIDQGCARQMRAAGANPTGEELSARPRPPLRHRPSNWDRLRAPWPEL